MIFIIVLSLDGEEIGPPITRPRHSWTTNRCVVNVGHPLDDMELLIESLTRGSGGD
ncbi:MAG TPA: hypothetical protein VJM12_12035 [Pyrinomonadaceae bacterium]|nr:hypothetical protein [Pyrinomonadaceae bacterium]